jgi:hypothetical protein
MVCDAGGATVDLVSYKIARRNPLEFEEFVSSTSN